VIAHVLVILPPIPLESGKTNRLRPTNEGVKLMCPGFTTVNSTTTRVASYCIGVW